MKKLGIFIPIFLTIILACSIVPSVFAVTELFYDDGGNESFTYNNNGYGAVKFSLPTGLSKAQLLRVRYYISGQVYGDVGFDVYIFDSDGSTILFGPKAIIPTEVGWLYVDLISSNIIITGDFYVAMYWEFPAPSLGVDNDDPDLMSFTADSPPSWTIYTSGDFMIRAELEQPHTVGGYFTSVNKIGLLIPYIALVGLIGVVFSIFVTIKKSRT